MATPYVLARSNLPGAVREFFDRVDRDFRDGQAEKTAGGHTRSIRFKRWDIRTRDDGYLLRVFVKGKGAPGWTHGIEATCMDDGVSVSHESVRVLVRIGPEDWIESGWKDA